MDAPSTETLRPPQPGEFDMVRRSAAPTLDGIVTDLVGYRETAGAHFRQMEPASLVVPLVIGFAGPFGIGIGATAPEHFASFAAGLWAGPVTIESFGDACCLQVNFTPVGARRFFGIPMSELAEKLVAPDAILGAAFRALRERLGETPDWETRFRLVEAFVAQRVSANAAPPPQVLHAYRRITGSGGRAGIGRIAAEIEWSRKHLAARFSDQIGLTPKAVARIVRLERAIALSHSADATGWADIAAACGFADQPHLVNEFRVLAGAPPTEFFARAA